MTDGTLRRRPTIRDVADHAGVSPAAVSKVLRNAYGVSDLMRTRVNNAITELGYRPTVSARALRGTINTIGITISRFSNQFFTEVIAGVTDELRNGPFQLILAPVDQGAQGGYQAIESLYDRQVAGIITISPVVESEWLETLAARIPLVEIGRHDHSTNYDTVVGDDFRGATLVMDHLLDAGHRRIIHLTHEDQRTRDDAGTPHAIRRAAYEASMRRAGLTDQINVVATSFAERESAKAMLHVLAKDDAPTAVFAGNDDAALGVMRAIAEQGLTTDDIAVAGYDDAGLASHPNISLTSVNQHGHEMGRRSIARLLERLQGRTTATHEVLEPRLFIRNSTSPRPRYPGRNEQLASGNRGADTDSPTAAAREPADR